MEKLKMEKSLLSLLETEDMHVRNYNRDCDDIRFWEEEIERDESIRKTLGFSLDVGIDLRLSYETNRQKAIVKAMVDHALVRETRKEIQDYFRKLNESERRTT
jgi:hypothetical protein